MSTQPAPATDGQLRNLRTRATIAFSGSRLDPDILGVAHNLGIKAASVDALTRRDATAITDRIDAQIEESNRRRRKR